MHNIELGRVILNSDKTLSELEKESYDGGKSWQNDDNDTDIYLTTAGWQQTNEERLELISNEGSELKLRSKTSGVEFKLSVAAIDLNGKNIAETVARWATDGDAREFARQLLLKAPSATFSAGARGYITTFVNLKENYELWFSTNGCNGTDLIALNGNCDTAGNRATSLDSVLNAVGSTNTISIHMFEETSFVLYKDGSVRFKHYNDGQWSEIAQTGTWERRTVNGAEMLFIPIPVNLRERNESHAAFLAVHNGYVRRGEYSPKDGTETELNLNKTAFENLIQTMGITSPF